MKGKLSYSPKKINLEIKKELISRDWTPLHFTYYTTDDESLTREIVNFPAKEQKREILDINKDAIRSKHQVDFVKDRIAIEVQFGKYAFIEFDLFVKHLVFYNRNEIDLGIEIIPTKWMQSQISSGPGYYERILCDMEEEHLSFPLC